MYSSDFYGNIGFGDWSVTIGGPGGGYVGYPAYPPVYPQPYPYTPPVYGGGGFALDSTLIMLVILGVVIWAVA
jgi:hypothetical protein